MAKKAQPQTQPQERVSNPQSARSWLATMVDGKRLAFSAMPSDAEKRAALEAKVLGTEVQSVIAWTDYLGNV